MCFAGSKSDPGLQAGMGPMQWWLWTGHILCRVHDLRRVLQILERKLIRKLIRTVDRLPDGTVLLHGAAPRNGRFRAPEEAKTRVSGGW